MDYAPISVALKFGFLAVLYLFLLWIARSALKDLRRTTSPAYRKASTCWTIRERSSIWSTPASME